MKNCCLVLPLPLLVLSSLQRLQLVLSVEKHGIPLQLRHGRLARSVVVDGAGRPGRLQPLGVGVSERGRGEGLLVRVRAAAISALRGRGGVVLVRDLALLSGSGFCLRRRSGLILDSRHFACRGKGWSHKAMEVKWNLRDFQ